MQNTFFTLITASFLFAVTFQACDKKTITQQYEKLPELPAELAATLDPKTKSTKIPVFDPTPVEDPGVAAAPCCSSTDWMEVQVRYPHTKCGPLRDFIVPPLSGVVSTAMRASVAANAGPGQSGTVGDIRAFKLSTFQGQTVLDQHVCFNSSGPWSATLSIERRCVGYQPINSLAINAFGDLVLLTWPDGPQNRPPQLQSVSCRLLSISRSQCGRLSSCDCTSSTCKPPDPCNCNLGW